MMLQRIFVMAFVAVAFVVGASSTARAQDTAIVTYNNNCLIPDANRVVRVFKCTDGGIRYTIRNGVIKTPDNYCFDHSIPRGQNGGDRSVKLVRCHGGQSQVWYVIKLGPGTGLIQSAANADVCLNIKSGNDAPGGELIVWPCGFNRPANNEYFFIGGKMDWKQFGGLDASARNALNSGKGITYNNGVRMVAAGAGNMVAAGAGNMVAAGAGNLVGNDGASIALKLIGTDSAGLRGVTFRIN